jgi:hypothetical protein
LAEDWLGNIKKGKFPSPFFYEIWLLWWSLDFLRRSDS